MKIHVFKVLTSTALIATLFAPSAFAAEKESNPSDISSIKTVEQLDGRFNLETVKEIPNDSVPIEFDSVEEAAKYLESIERGNVNSNSSQVTQVTPYNTSEVVVKTASFRTTTKAKCTATVSYVSMSNGMIDVTKVTSKSTGDASWTWKQSSYATKKLDGGRSVQISISGILTNSIVVNGEIKKYNYSETVSVEI